MASKETSEPLTYLPLPPHTSAAAQANARAMAQALADPLDPAGECPVCYEKFTSRSRFRFHLGKHFCSSAMRQDEGVCHLLLYSHITLYCTLHDE